MRKFFTARGFKVGNCTFSGNKGFPLKRFSLWNDLSGKKFFLIRLETVINFINANKIKTIFTNVKVYKFQSFILKNLKYFYKIYLMLLCLNNNIES